MSKSFIFKYRDAQIMKLARQGKTLNEIAEELNYSPSQIRRIVKKLMDPEEYQLFKDNNQPKKYTLWPPSIVRYQKGLPECGVCFYLKYNNKNLPIGGFKDFVSPQIIHDLIEEMMIYD